jgi:thiol:disulfide interchange protein DsbA
MPLAVLAIVSLWACSPQDTATAPEPAAATAATTAGASAEAEAEAATATATATPSPISRSEPAPQPRIALAQTDTPGASQQFTLGTHYERLSPTQPTSSGPEQIEVAEIFWYGCPHCYTFDPYLESWKENLPSDVSFVRIPALWNEVLQVHGRIYYTAEALNKVDEMHAAIFREMHVNRNSLDSPGTIQALFANYGVDAETFNNTFESFAVFTKLQRADELARRYRISSVPTVIVNGKYTTDATKAGGYPQLLAVIDELVAMERAGE